MNSLFVSRTKYGKDCLETMVSKGHVPKAIFTLKEDYKDVISDFGEFDELSKRENIPLYKIDDIRFYKQIFGTNYEPSLLRSKENIELMKGYNPELIWLFGFGELIEPKSLKIPEIGWIGSHPTLLPKYRGGAPLVYPLLKGHTESGCTLMWLNEGIDTGEILAQKKFKIDINDNAKSVYHKMTDCYSKIIKEVIPKFNRGIFPRRKQDESLFIEQWKPRTPKDSEINFDKPKDERTMLRYIHDQIRCVSGVYPSAFIKVGDKKIILKKSKFNPKKNKLKVLEVEVI